MVKTKVLTEELKKAIEYIEANSRELTLKVSITGKELILETFDRNDDLLTITIFNTDCEYAAKKTVTTRL